MLKIGMVGCGRMARIHLDCLKKIDGVEVWGVVDPVEASRNAVAEQLSAKAYASMSEMFSNIKPDAVYITTPIKLHLENIRDAFEAGCHVFCEKPLIPTEEDGKEIRALAGENKDKILFTGQCWRFDPTVARIRSCLREGLIGDVVQFRAMCGGPAAGNRPAWFEERSIAVRGCMLDNGVHFFDLINFITGDQIVKVASICDQTDEKVDLNAVAVLLTAGGKTGTMQFTSQAIMGASLEIFGTTGKIVFMIGKPEFTVSRKDAHDAVVEAGEGNRFEIMNRHFIECLSGGPEPAVTLEDALRAALTAVAGYSSHEEGGLTEVQTA